MESVCILLKIKIEYLNGMKTFYSIKNQRIVSIKIKLGMYVNCIKKIVYKKNVGKFYPESKFLCSIY